MVFKVKIFGGRTAWLDVAYRVLDQPSSVVSCHLDIHLRLVIFKAMVVYKPLMPKIIVF
jgi:hypothetical protein